MLQDAVCFTSDAFEKYTTAAQLATYLKMMFDLRSGVELHRHYQWIWIQLRPCLKKGAAYIAGSLLSTFTKTKKTGQFFAVKNLKKIPVRSICSTMLMLIFYDIYRVNKKLKSCEEVPAFQSTEGHFGFLFTLYTTLVINKRSICSIYI